MTGPRTHLKIRLDNVLKLVACCYNYGFQSLCLFEGLADMLDGELTDEEIDLFVEHLVKTDSAFQRIGLSKRKTMDQWRDSLRTFRERFIYQTKSSAPATE